MGALGMVCILGGWALLFGGTLLGLVPFFIGLLLLDAESNTFFKE